MQAQFFIAWVKDYAQQAKLNNERHLVVLAGSESWALSLLSSIERVSRALNPEVSGNFQHAPHDENIFFFGDNKSFPTNIQKSRYRDKLGSESEMIIFFADKEFPIDAFAALSGTLKAGGLFFLVMPDVEKKSQESLFFKRFYTLIDTMPCHTIINEEQACQTPENPPVFEINGIQEKGKNNQLSQSALSLGCITSEQHHAVQDIVKVVSGHRKRPLVLTADRGRGKSSALAIACAQLLEKNAHHAFTIIVTAPDIQALSVFFKQLSKSLPEANKQGSFVTFGQAILQFVAVDQLIKQSVKVNLVVVDEAAAIPVYMLERLLRNYHRMVFASTVHGYEGAGRGFTLKFQKSLDNLCPQWSSLHIKQPIRWRQDDPLEQLVFESCLLNAELPVINSWKQESNHENSSTALAPIATSVFKVVTAQELIVDEPLLQQVFAVLVTAHYQTKPSDLQLLLDNPQVQLACLFSSNANNAEVIAVALIMKEGRGNGIEATDINAIKSSQRRLRNHFLPQSLLSHCGFEQAFDYGYLRIMRIAVHPQVQQQGLGSYFIGKIQQLASEQGTDFVGASFGVNDELLAFWLKADFTPVRIGFTKDKASGEHSALVIKGNNQAAAQRQKQLKADFYRSFDYLLLDEYKTLSSELVRLLLAQQIKEQLPALSAHDWRNVQAYATGERLYSSCAYSLYLWLKHDLLSQDKECSAEVVQQSLVLIARLIQKHDIDTVCTQYMLTGKKMLNLCIKDYVSKRISEVNS